MFLYWIIKYLGKLPETARNKDIFYCKPLPVAPDGDDTPWYYAIPVGNNVLGNMVSDMCSEASVNGKKKKPFTTCCWHYKSV